MKKEFLDVCHFDLQRAKELENLGYFVTGQTGGCDEYSFLIYSLPETEEEKIVVRQEHEKQVNWAKCFWDSIGGRNYENY